MELKGVLPTLITPFTETGELDTDSLRKYVNFMINCGVNGLVPLGAAGEITSLTSEEIKEVLKVTVEEANKRVPIIAGVASTGTKLALDFAKSAEEIGADAIMLQPTYYLAKTSQAVYSHFKSIAEAIKIPVVLYDNPKATGTKFSQDFVRRLSNEVSNIKYLKVSADIFIEWSEWLPVVKGKLGTFIGVDWFALPALVRGVDGIMTGLGSVAPRECIEMYNAVKKRELDHAYEIFYRLLPYIQVAEYGPMHWYRQSIKGALKSYGVIKSDYVRLPLVPMSELRAKELQRALRYAKLSYQQMM